MVALGMRGIILAGILATTALLAVWVVLLSSTSWGAQQESSSAMGGVSIGEDLAAPQTNGR